MRTSPNLINFLRSIAQSPFTVALVVGVIFGQFMLGYLQKANNDVSRLIHASLTRVDPAQVPARIYVPDDKNNGGYDGQFVYRLALDPFSRKKTEYGISLDAPAYRQQRILLPILAWTLARGKPQRIALALVLVNYAALCVIGLTAALYARALGASAWWGLLPALYPGFLLSFSRDLTEPVSVCFLLLGLLLLRRGYFALSTLSLCLSILGRDTAILTAGAIGLVWAWEQAIRWRWIPQKLQAWVQGNLTVVPAIPFYVPAVPIAMYAGWLLYLKSVWGIFPFQEYADPLEPFFQAFYRFVGRLIAHWQTGSFKPLEDMWLIECALLALLVITTLMLWRRTTASLVERFGWLIYLGLASCYGANIWVEDYSFLRVLCELWTFSALIIIGTPLRFKQIIGIVALYLFWLTLQSYQIR